MSDQSIAVLVPAFNAGRTLPLLLQGLDNHVSREQVLVVDDGSRDDTLAVLRRAGVPHVVHEHNTGKGAALRTGLEWLMDRPSWEALVTMDADLQHRPEDLPLFTEMWAKGGTDLLLGARARFGTGMPVTRVLSNTITSFLVSSRCGSPVLDSQCGYRMLSREVVENVRFDSDGYEAETELLVRALIKGFRVQSVAIQTVYGGEKSHMTPWLTTQRFVSVLFRDY